MPALEEFPQERRIAKVKITDYLLNGTHEDGAPKAAFFRAFGFSLEQWEEMREALSLHPDANPVEKKERTAWGTKYIVRCSVATPDGRNPCIRSVWMEERMGEVAFLTAYPAD